MRLSDIVADERRAGTRRVLVVLAVMLLVAGCAYTGAHNYALFARVLEPDWLALVPVLLLEGSLLLLMAGQAVWFSGSVQRLVATVASWMLFVILALNTVLDSRLALSADVDGLMRVYAESALYAAPILVVALWKLILDADPSHRALVAEALARAAVEEARRQAMIAALDTDEVSAAVRARQAAASREIAARVVGEEIVVPSVRLDGRRPKASGDTSGGA